MRRSISVLGIAVTTLGLSLATVQAHAVTIKPGPVKVVFPPYSGDEPRMGDTSALIITANWPSQLATSGPIVWRGRLYKRGILKFPAVKQTWPNAIISATSIKRLRGKIRSNGKVRLTGTLKAKVSEPGISCKVTSPIVLSTRITAGLGLPSGQDYDPATGEFALMSKPLILSSEEGGVGCAQVVGFQPVMYLTGAMKIPGGVPIPKS